MSQVTLKIDGMHCGACVRRVTQALESASNGAYTVQGVSVGEAKLDFATTPDASTAVNAINAIGFTATEAK